MKKIDCNHFQRTNSTVNIKCGTLWQKCKVQVFTRTSPISRSPKPGETGILKPVSVNKPFSRKPAHFGPGHSPNHAHRLTRFTLSDYKLFCNHVLFLKENKPNKVVCSIISINFFQLVVSQRKETDSSVRSCECECIQLFTRFHCTFFRACT